VGERLGHARLPAVDRKARAIGDDDVREIEELAPAAPRRELEECVGAEQQRDATVAPELVSQLRQRIDGVTRAAALRLARVDTETRVAGDSELCHRDPI